MTAIISDYIILKVFHVGNIVIKFQWFLVLKMVWILWVSDRASSWDPLVVKDFSKMNANISVL